jgi:hypothetical protein
MYPDNVVKIVHILLQNCIFCGVQVGLKYIYKPCQYPTLKQRMLRPIVAGYGFSILSISDNCADVLSHVLSSSLNNITGIRFNPNFAIYGLTVVVWCNRIN